MKNVLIFICLVFFSSTVFAECNETLIDKIKLDLSEKREQIDDLTVCKQWQGKDGLDIFVLTFESGDSIEKNGYAYYDVYILVYNTLEKKIENFLYQKKLWKSDAVTLEELKIDTAATYKLTNNTTAFGVRAVFSGSSKLNPHTDEQLSLYIRDKNSLKKVLSDLSISSEDGKWDGVCEGRFYTSQLTVHVDKSTTGEFSDIRIRKKSQESNHVNNVKECDEVDEKPIIESYIMKYDGVSYKIPK